MLPRGISRSLVPRLLYRTRHAGDRGKFEGHESIFPPLTPSPLLPSGGDFSHFSSFRSFSPSRLSTRGLLSFEGNGTLKPRPQPTAEGKT